MRSIKTCFKPVVGRERAARMDLRAVFLVALREVSVCDIWRKGRRWRGGSITEQRSGLVLLNFDKNKMVSVN